MKTDPVLDRIQEARHSISMQFDHDPKKIVAYYLNRQKSRKKQNFIQTTVGFPNVPIPPLADEYNGLTD